MDQIKNRFTGEIMCGGLSLKVVLEKHRMWLRNEDGGSRANLSDADLSDTTLSRAILSDTNLSRAILSGANLSHADLRDSDLSDATLSRAILREADLSDAILSRANLSHADLSRATLSRAILSRANLSRAILREADLSDAILSRANLSHADLSRATLSRAILSGANLSHASLIDASLIDAILSHTDLSGVPKIPNIHQVVYAAASQKGALNMGDWHTCETTHCRAGWVVHLAGEAGAALEYAMGTPAAATIIYMASDPKLEKIPNFYASDKDALADMKRLAELEKATSA